MAGDDPVEQSQHSAAARLQHTGSIKCPISPVHKALCTILMSDCLCKLCVVHTERNGCIFHFIRLSFLWLAVLIEWLAQIHSALEEKYPLVPKQQPLLHNGQITHFHARDLC